jgi:hypothetical protein
MFAMDIDLSNLENRCTPCRQTFARTLFLLLLSGISALAIAVDAPTGTAPTTAGAVTATAYDEAGNVAGTSGSVLGTLAAQQMATYTSAQLEAAIGYTPSTPTAKYRIAFSANLSAFDVINFTKDLATGNLALAQAQTDSPASSTALSCTRNAFFVLASTSPGRTSVLRLINTNAQAGTLTATAYNEDGNTVGTVNAPLGMPKNYKAS